MHLRRYKKRYMNLIRYFISLFVGTSFEYCHGEVPFMENGRIKEFPTENMAQSWIDEHPEIFENSLYRIKPI